MLEFRDITHTYRSTLGETVALAGVSLSLACGEQLAVLGGNGSGKSTLVRLANGLMLPDAGTVTVDWIDTFDATRARELRQRLGIVFQRPDDQIVATAVEDDVAFGPENLGLERSELRGRVDDALAAVGLTGLERREPHLLSGGQKQRLAIAGALAMHPTYLVLDEPTSMLDPAGRADVLAIVERLRAQGTGILHVTHDLADVLSADRAVVLECGRLAFEGTIAELLRSGDELAAWGLELPPISVLAERLAGLGVPIDLDVASPEALVGALWG